MTDPELASRFAHHRLDAYRVAFRLLRGVEELAQELPRGHADLKDQMRRAASSTVRHLAEGANRVHPKDKAARFTVACGEVGETDATLEMAAAFGLAPPSRVRELRCLASRVAAILCGLIRRQQRRQIGPG